jgi:hypothetical protein
MTKNEIIDYVVDYYQNNDRAVERGGCVYLTSDGRRCAHSICLQDEVVKNLELTGTSAPYVIKEYGDQVHKYEFRGHEVTFWRDIQTLHDDSDYWNGRELTEFGEAFVNKLKQRYEH